MFRDTPDSSDTGQYREPTWGWRYGQWTYLPSTRPPTYEQGNGNLYGARWPDQPDDRSWRTGR